MAPDLDRRRDRDGRVNGAGSFTTTAGTSCRAQVGRHRAPIRRLSRGPGLDARRPGWPDQSLVRPAPVHRDFGGEALARTGRADATVALGVMGVFDAVTGLLVGRLVTTPDDGEGRARVGDRDVVAREFGRPDLPIVANLDFGHTDPQWVCRSACRPSWTSTPGGSAWSSLARLTGSDARDHGGLRAGVTQLGECLLPKQDVEGSCPSSRSTSPSVLSVTRRLRVRACRFLGAILGLSRPRSSVWPAMTAADPEARRHRHVPNRPLLPQQS